MPSTRIPPRSTPPPRVRRRKPRPAGQHDRMLHRKEIAELGVQGHRPSRSSLLAGWRPRKALGTVTRGQRTSASCQRIAAARLPAGRFRPQLDPMSEATVHMPWHEGELAASTSQASNARPTAWASATSCPTSTAVFAEQPSCDRHRGEAGAPAVTLLTGEPGFVASPDPRTLAILAARRPGRAATVKDDAHRRARHPAAHPPPQPRHGWIAYASDDGLLVGVLQSFGNARSTSTRARWLTRRRRPARSSLRGLDGAARAAVAAADTFFVPPPAGRRLPTAASTSPTAGARGLREGGRRRADDPGLPRQPLLQHRSATCCWSPARPALRRLRGRAMTQLQGRAECSGPPRPPHAERTLALHVERGWRSAAGVRQVAVQAPSTESAAPVAEPPRSETR